MTSGEITSFATTGRRTARCYDASAPSAWEPRAGTYALVNLWGSWCRPCLHELKDLSRRREDLKAAGVEWCTPHSLRHTFASQLAIKGVSLYKISKWLGHADFKTTQIYAHLQAHDEDINRF